MLYMIATTTPIADDEGSSRSRQCYGRWHDRTMSAVRRARYHNISAFLALCSDDEMASWIDAAPAGTVGVGGASILLDVRGIAVFAKRVPVTDLEWARPQCTANLFDLPMYCQYGIGGPGFGAWRELAANLIVTEAVLAGETSAFPLLYHWRVLPGRPAIADEHVDIDVAVAALGGSPAVRARLEALADASYSLVLFLEYVPHPLLGWLQADPMGTAESLDRQLSEIVAFLRSRELLHMDGHFDNMRTDGEQIYFTDFGLATSVRFELSPVELAFAERHATHDAAYASMRLVNWLVTAVCGVRVPAVGRPVARNQYVQRCAAGYIPNGVPPAVAAIIARHAPSAATLNSFYWRLFGGDVLAPYPDLPDA
jgi:hypothetical protein